MRGSVDEEAEVGVVLGDLHEVIGSQAVAEEFGERLSVSGADSHAER